MEKGYNIILKVSGPFYLPVYFTVINVNLILFPRADTLEWIIKKMLEKDKN